MLVCLYAGISSHSGDHHMHINSLVRLFAGISSNSECHRPHSTRSGKQRKIVRYEVVNS